MVVLHFTPIPQPTFLQSSSSSSSSSSSRLLTSGITPNAFTRVPRTSFHAQTELFNGLKIQGANVLKQRGPMVVKASAEIDGGQPESTTPPSETKDESLSVEELPLESKLQLKLDQKIKMKLAKKLRLRRKRLVRKRQLRKKGRWPPSKMKKNKNV
ncbi:large ribosomal subunit protein cL37 alpha-like isoform X2 [Rutidosis leptorrhynchoides]|uniref:large ribosomal subunit protein cL37 alpha-like isoform X2 n=1 Tax=Rutidosis leptorrhynchoides TaxID=125765 RepID=UPI003A99DD49